MTHEERDQLIIDNQKLVGFVVRKFIRYGLGHLADELSDEGQLALVLAARDYDPTRGSFSSWAITRMQWQIQSFLRKQDTMTKVQRIQYRETGEFIMRPTIATEHAIQKGTFVKAIDWRGYNKATWYELDIHSIRKGLMMHGCL